MDSIVILGAAGLAREFYFYIKRAKPNIRNFLFVNDLPDEQIKIEIDSKIYPVIKDWKFDEKYNFIVAVGNPKIKRILVEKAISAGLKPAETIIDPSAIIVDKKGVKIGLGGVIAPGCIITTNVVIKDYVTLNLNTTIGHDTVIGDFCTTNPGVHISGQCIVGEACEFGTGCIVRDRLIVGNFKKIGAQSAVVKNIDNNETEEVFVGVPAKKLK